MRGLLVAVALLAACSRPEPPADDRMPIAVEYVRAAEAPIHAHSSDVSRVVTRYQSGEAVPILARKGDWVEVRTASGSGWAKAADLATSQEASKGTSDTLTPRFLRPPEPVSQPGATGEIVLEAAVNTSGDVVSVRILSNTTGSAGLEQRNIAALQKAKFAPIVRHGERHPFTYEHRVHY
jgi:TonB family protein